MDNKNVILLPLKQRRQVMSFDHKSHHCTGYTLGIWICGCSLFYKRELWAKIQQTKMLVTCQRFGDWFLFGLVWQYSLIQKNIMKVGSKSLLTYLQQ